MKRTSKSLLAIVATFALLAAPAARAADVNIKAFYGKFQGNGVAKDKDSVYFGVTARDFDVEFRPTKTGFTATWTSVIRGGGNPEKPNVRRKSSSLGFVPTKNPKVWRAVSSGDPSKGETATWARLNKNTLSIYLMVMRRNGTYEIQRYDRTLSARGMELVFTRTRDGEQVRSVKGRLVKVAK